MFSNNDIGIQFWWMLINWIFHDNIRSVFIEDIRHSLFLCHAYIIDTGTLKTLQYPHNINNLTTITSSIYVYTSQIALDICRELVRKEHLPAIDTTPPIITIWHRLRFISLAISLIYLPRVAITHNQVNCLTLDQI